MICDILFLQELMLCRSYIHFLYTLSGDFDNASFVCDREPEGIVEGCPVTRLLSCGGNVYISVDDSLIGIIFQMVMTKY